MINKFRAWDSRVKCMVDDFVISADGYVNRLWEAEKYHPSAVEALNKDWNDYGDYYVIDGTDFYASEHYEVMQWTGLLDSNKKKIYEGDIVSVDDFFSGDFLVGKDIGEVRFDNGSFFINYKCAPDLCSEEIYNNKIVVIGNVYENPELLK